MNKVLKTFIGVVTPLSMILSLIGCSCASNSSKRDQIVNPKIEKIQAATNELEKITIANVNFEPGEQFLFNVDVRKPLAKKILEPLQKTKRLFLWLTDDSFEVDFVVDPANKPELIFTSKADFMKKIPFYLKAKATDNEKTVVSVMKNVLIFANDCLDMKDEANILMEEFEQKISRNVSLETINEQNLLAKLKSFVPDNENLKFRFDFDNKLKKFLNTTNIIANEDNYKFELTVKISHRDAIDNISQDVLTKTINFNISGLHNKITVYLEKFKNYFGNTIKEKAMLQDEVIENFDKYINEYSLPENMSIKYEFVNQITGNEYYPDIFISAVDKITHNEIETVVINNIKLKSMSAEVEAMFKKILKGKYRITEEINDFEAFKKYVNENIFVKIKENSAINNLSCEIEESKFDWTTKVETTDSEGQITVNFYLTKPSGQKVKPAISLTLWVKGLKGKVKN